MKASIIACAVLLSIAPAAIGGDGVLINDAGIVMAAPTAETQAQLNRIEAMLCAFKPPERPTCTIEPGERSCMTVSIYDGRPDWRINGAPFEHCP